MNIYKILRLAGNNGIPPFLKIMGLWLMHWSGKRTIGIFIDPVMGCNLRCKMCYFSDPVKRRSLKGVISDEYLDQVEKALFHRALKLQIGCGAEPTLYNKLPELISRGKRSGIPYISITTNGQLLASDKIDLRQLAEAGLNELTLSLHGTTSEIYENLMPGAKYQTLLESLREIASVKHDFKDFKLRINLTINSLNITDLTADKFWGLFQNTRPDVIQLRPVQKIGESEWNDFDLTPLHEHYDATIGQISKRCAGLGITCITPSIADLDEIATEQYGASALIEDITYCYVSPQNCYKPDFDPAADTYESYHRRHHTSKMLFQRIFNASGGSRQRNTSKKLNYRIN